jgi:hypothetical protein
MMNGSVVAPKHAFTCTGQMRLGFRFLLPSFWSMFASSQRIRVVDLSLLKYGQIDLRVLQITNNESPCTTLAC